MVKKLLQKGTEEIKKQAAKVGKAARAGKVAGKPRPEHHVSMKLGEGWHRRNFLTEVIIPSLFSPREEVLSRSGLPELTGNQIGITWIGHASFLIQTPEHSVLIDPNWAKWLKVIKRLKQPGLEIHELPAIDLVLVSHAHFDHLDKRSLRAVASDQPIVVPEHVGNLVQGLGFNRVHELRRWESMEVGSLKITLTPAQHWGARVLHDRHRGFGGFLVEYAGRTIYHCGDSAWFEGFEEIGRKGKIDIALLPIGAYDAPTGRDVHMNPEEALRAFTALNAGLMIPMHYGTFRLGFEPLEEPPDRLLGHARSLGIDEKIRILREGQPAVF
jgi:L-ascorbate metabolism protein UlaG (beta-lactamase superfamily)